MKNEKIYEKIIKITGNSEDNLYKFKDEKKFIYKQSNSFTLIETDKPVYKPGQKSIKNNYTVNW